MTSFANKVEYIRQFHNTNWQAIYIPFDISVNNLNNQFDVACLNNIHQYDDNNDGVPERTDLEVFIMQPSEIIKANTPYLIRAKEPGVFTMVASQATIHPLQSNSLDCSSVSYRYIFNGTYNEISGPEMLYAMFYAMSQGVLCQAGSESAFLSPFRWYMKVINRIADKNSYAPKFLNIVDMSSSETTGFLPIDSADAVSTQTGFIYDLNGRLIRTDGNLQALPKGFYILNGKKVVR